MRVKQIWTYVPIPAKLKLFYDRITLTRITTIYFVFSLLHCIVQTGFQVKAYTMNAASFDFLSGIVAQGNVSPVGFPVLGDDLRICTEVPQRMTADSCKVWWDGKALGNNTVNDKTSTPPVSSVLVPVATQTTESLAPVASPTTPPRPVVVIVEDEGDDSDDESDDDDDDDDDDVVNNRLGTRQVDANVDAIRILNTGGWIEIIGFGFEEKVILDQQCLAALRYPVAVLANTKREDVVFITFQAWVLGMSIVAILNESIPHIIASLLTHVLATAWAAFQIAHTNKFRSEFVRLTVEGACAPYNLLPTYWRERRNAEYPSMALNAVGLLVSAYLTWRLVRLFGWQTFKRVGASLRINRIYKIVLSMSIVLQLAVFFVAATLGLWIDQLYNSPIASMAALANVYKPLFMIAVILTVPWVVSGWIAIRREMRGLMAVFLVISFLYMGSWGVMFLSDTYRWTFFQWRFFSIITIASAVLTVAATVLAVVCRLNFGLELSKYLTSQESLPGHDFVPAYPEKGDVESNDTVYFPNEKAVPTFSAAFGSSNEVVPPSQMQFCAPGPFASQSPVAAPLRAVTRPLSSSSSQKSMLERHASDQSARSYRSTSSNGSVSRGAPRQKDGKRWVIE